MKKSLCILGIICCIFAGSAVSAAYDTTTITDKIITQSNDISASPYSLYFYKASITPSRTTNSLNINVRTQAAQYVDKIYHDVTIYKNWTWVSSERYSDTDIQELETSISVGAQSGDYIEIYVDHYVSHNGTTESKSTSQTLTF